jgi:hypothetical protein
MHDNGPQHQNVAPNVFWLSTAAYRTIFYQMGQGSRERSDQFLDQVHRKMRLG